jgi:hypothetical protein
MNTVPLKVRRAEKRVPGPCRQIATAPRQLSLTKFEPDWFAANIGPLFREWLFAQYGGNAQLIARAFGVSRQCAYGWLSMTNRPKASVAVGAVVAFPAFRQSVEAAYAAHLGRAA